MLHVGLDLHKKYLTVAVRVAMLGGANMVVQRRNRGG